MGALDRFVEASVRWVSVAAGVVTAVAVVGVPGFAGMNRLLFGGQLTADPSTVPLLRHWAFMIAGVGVLLVAGAFRPSLRWPAWLFATAEKLFIVFLWLTARHEPWGAAYQQAALTDGVLAVYGLLYLASGVARRDRQAGSR